jgi:hypothetical protein
LGERGESLANRGHRTRGLRSRRARRTGALRLPDFIAVGPPRTGTTWLDRVLRGHVGLPAEVKETQFFVWNYRLGLDWYRAFFRECAPGIPVGEIAPTYFDQPPARERIAATIPNCKVICSLRDPVVRAYSQYKTWHRSGLVEGPFDYERQARRLGANGSYAANVKAWHAALGRGQVLVQIYEDLASDRQAYLDAFCTFAGIERIVLEGSEFGEGKINPSEQTPRSLRLARAGGRLRTWSTRHPALGIAQHLEQGTPLWRFFFAGGPNYPRLDPEVEANLREKLQPEIEELEELLGRDLTAWKTPRALRSVDATVAGG